MPGLPLGKHRGLCARSRPGPRHVRCAAPGAPHTLSEPLPSPPHSRGALGPQAAWSLDSDPTSLSRYPGSLHCGLRFPWPPWPLSCGPCIRGSSFTEQLTLSPQPLGPRLLSSVGGCEGPGGPDILTRWSRASGQEIEWGALGGQQRPPSMARPLPRSDALSEPWAGGGRCWAAGPAPGQRALS